MDIITICMLHNLQFYSCIPSFHPEHPIPGSPKTSSFQSTPGKSLCERLSPSITVIL